MNTAHGTTEFLPAARIHAAYAQCIADAEEELVLVAPWFTPSEQMLDGLFALLARGARLTLVTRTPGEARTDRHDEALRKLLDRAEALGRKRANRNGASAIGDVLDLLLVDNVHAKAVVQDEVCVVISSSNLNVASATRNTEFGMLSTLRSVVQGALGEVETLRSSDRCRSFENGRIARCACGQWILDDACGACDRSCVPLEPKAASKPTRRAGVGFCVRCAGELPWNRARPLCPTCFGAWRRYENREYEESHCHDCGAEAATTINRPVCTSCSRER